MRRKFDARKCCRVFGYTERSSLNVCVINLSKVSKPSLNKHIERISTAESLHHTDSHHRASLRHLSFSLISFSFDGFLN